jgi:hypothetical protein
VPSLGRSKFRNPGPQPAKGVLAPYVRSCSRRSTQPSLSSYTHVQLDCHELFRNKSSVDEGRSGNKTTTMTAAMIFFVGHAIGHEPVPNCGALRHEYRSVWRGRNNLTLAMAISRRGIGCGERLLQQRRRTKIFPLVWSKRGQKGLSRRHPSSVCRTLCYCSNQHGRWMTYWEAAWSKRQSREEGSSETRCDKCRRALRPMKNTLTRGHCLGIYVGEVPNIGRKESLQTYSGGMWKEPNTFPRDRGPIRHLVFARLAVVLDCFNQNRTTRDASV